MKNVYVFDMEIFMSQFSESFFKSEFDIISRMNKYVKCAIVWCVRFIISFKKIKLFPKISAS